MELLTEKLREEPLFGALVALVLVANLAALVLMARDKRLARKNRARIPEATLLAPVLGGGVLGVLAGMALFKHKTKNPVFQVKLAVTTIAWAVGIVMLLELDAGRTTAHAFWGWLVG